MYNSNEISFERGVGYLIDESNDGIYDYSFSDPDFNFRQFRSNLVVRWEFIPGSTMFLAWSQSKTDFEESSTEFNFKENFKKLFKVTPHDIFLLKISYRLQAGKFI